MATLTVLKFNDPAGADNTQQTLLNLQKQELIKIHDAATVSWPADKSKPKTRQLTNLTGAGAMSGMFWGMLFGILFLVPLLGAAIGAGMGALTGSMADIGIDDDFIRDVRNQITPGTSALFLLTSDAVLDKVREAMAGTEFELVHTNLSAEEEANLRKAFEEE